MSRSSQLPLLNLQVILYLLQVENKEFNSTDESWRDQIGILQEKS